MTLAELLDAELQLPEDVWSILLLESFTPSKTADGFSYIRKGAKNIVKEHNSHVTSAVYKHSISNNHPWAIISHFQTIDQDGTQIAREAREAIQISVKTLP